MNFSEITQIAVDSAQESAKILKKGFTSKKEVKTKSQRHDFVTQYDIESEKCIISLIKKKYPSHTFLSEEAGNIGSSDDEIKWIIDPLDGTVNFVHNVPVFSVSIAAYKGNEALCGVVLQPITNELFIAEKEKGAYLNGKRIYTTDIKQLEDAFLATGFPYAIKDNPSNYINHLEKFLYKGLPIRRLGSAAIDLAYVAAGIFDGFFEPNLGPWDFAAGKLLIEEANGTFTNWKGKEFDVLKDKEVLATNGKIHKQMIEALKD